MTGLYLSPAVCEINKSVGLTGADRAAMHRTLSTILSLPTIRRSL